MSRGFGAVQRQCLESLASGRRLTTFTVAAEVYSVSRDAKGNRFITEAQHVAVKRALGNLRRKGLVVGAVNMGIVQLRSDGSPASGKAERCTVWVKTGSGVPRDSA